MSIDQTDIIDAVGVDNTGSVVLTVSDHLQWNKEHFLMLQEKLNTYLAFVEGGELTDSYPDAKDRNVLINVVCKYAPDTDAENFLGQVNKIVEGAGMKFSYQVFSTN